MTGRYAGDVSFRGNLDVGAAGAETNKQHGLPFQLPAPAGTGPSPFAGGLLNVASLMQASGWKTAHYGKWVRLIALLLNCAIALSLKTCFGKPPQHLGGCSPLNTHTPRPSEYGFDATATHASPLEAGCLSSTDTDADLGKRSALIPNATWWSADVDDVAKQLTISFIRNASRGGPFYVQLWLHMSHATIDPRPEQFEAYPYAETCLSECSNGRL